MGCTSNKDNGGCCPPGSWPALTVDYKPNGQTQVLQNGTKVYHTGQGKKVLIILHDIFGAFSGRHQSIADTFAKLGYNVYLPQLLPNFYKDDPTDLSKIGPYIASIDNKPMKKTFEQLFARLAKQGHTKYFMVGFCWGVWKIFDLSIQGCQGIIAFAGFHPALIVERIIGGNDVEQAKKVNHPGFLYPAGNDQANIKPGGEITNILISKFGKDKAGSLQYPNMTHGWMTRADYTSPNVQQDTEAALKHCQEYFSKFQI